MKAQILVLASYVMMAVSMGLTPSVSLADDYPSKPVELIVTYAPGGSTDTTARTVSPGASELLGQALVVINKPGAGGALALSSVAKAKPDGYTLVIFAINAPILNAINPKAGFDSVKDFAPVCNFIKQANILVVPAASKITSVAEYVKAAKENPGKMVAGSSGVGSSQHFSAEMFKKIAGVDITHVPHKGSNPCVTALLGNHIDSGFINAPDVLQHIKAGTLRALAVTTTERIPDLPGVPTIAESGYPEYEVVSWVGCAAPAGTPAPVVQKLSAAFAKVMEDPALNEKFKSIGFIPSFMPSDNFGTWIKKEYDKFTTLAKEANITIE